MDTEELVVFKNSPLYNYLAENSIFDCNIQSKGKCDDLEKYILKEPKCHNLNKSDTNLNTYLSAIFQSGLLLKEDCETLQFVFSTTHSQTCTNSILSNKICIVFAFSAFVIANQLKRKPYIHILTTSIVPASYYLFKMYKVWRNKANVESLVLQTKTILNKVRNLVKFLYDYDVLLVSSRRADEKLTNNIKLNLFRQVVVDNMKNVINTFDDAVQKINLLEEVPLNKDSVISIQDNNTHSVSTIYNLLLLSQSTFFLHIGYVFCTMPSNKQDIIFESVVQIAQQELNSYTGVFDFLLSNFLCVNFVPNDKQNIEKNITPLKEVYNSLQNMCLMLHNMLVNSNDILRLFEEDISEEKQKIIFQKIQQGIQTFEPDLKKIQSYFNMLQINLERFTQYKKNNDPINIERKETERKPDLLKINFDDKEIHCDEVFEAFVGNDNEETLRKVYSDSDFLKKSQIEAYKLLLNELEPILRGKKQEWEVREAKLQQAYSIDKNINEILSDSKEINPKKELLLTEEGKLVEKENSNEMCGTIDLTHIMKHIKKPVKRGRRLPSKYSNFSKKQNVPQSENLSSKIKTSINTATCSLFEKEFAQIITQQRPSIFLQEDCISDGENSDV